MREQYFFDEAWDTVCVKWWEQWCATIFGRLHVTHSDDGTVYLREWRGKLYFIRYDPPNTD